jgi:hypothetical protein
MSRHRRDSAVPFWFRVFCYVIGAAALALLLLEIVQMTRAAGRG